MIISLVRLKSINEFTRAVNPTSESYAEHSFGTLGWGGKTDTS